MAEVGSEVTDNPVTTTTPIRELNEYMRASEFLRQYVLPFYAPPFFVLYRSSTTVEGG